MRDVPNAAAWGSATLVDADAYRPAMRDAFQFCGAGVTPFRRAGTNRYSSAAARTTPDVAVASPVGGPCLLRRELAGGGDGSVWPLGMGRSPEPR